MIIWSRNIGDFVLSSSDSTHSVVRLKEVTDEAGHLPGTFPISAKIFVAGYP
jgi:hypothetical protein